MEKGSTQPETMGRHLDMRVEGTTLFKGQILRDGRILYAKQFQLLGLLRLLQRKNTLDKGFMAVKLVKLTLELPSCLKTTMSC